MRSFFNMDGPIFTFFSKLADLMILNLLFIVCSLPIITIGASLTAMSYVCLKMKDGTEGYIWKSFLSSFRLNFKQATAIWLILAALLAILVTDLLVVRTLPSQMQIVMQVLVMIGLVLWLIVFLMVFPLQSRFYNPVKVTLHNALLLAIGNAPRMLLMVLIMAAAVVISLWNATTIGWGILIWIMFGFALLAYANCSIIYPALKKLMPPEEEMPDDSAFTVEEEHSEPAFTAGQDHVDPAFTAEKDRVEPVSAAEQDHIEPAYAAEEEQEGPAAGSADQEQKGSAAGSADQEQ